VRQEIESVQGSNLIRVFLGFVSLIALIALAVVSIKEECQKRKNQQSKS